MALAPLSPRHSSLFSFLLFGGGIAMSTRSDHSKDQTSYQCPVCANVLPHLAALPPFDAPCSECEAYLWCRQRASGKGFCLDIMPGRTPDPWEVEQVVKSILQRDAAARVVVNLSLLDVVSSSLIARLVTMSKDLHTGGARLSLVGLRPVVRETFDRLRLGKVFDILDADERITDCV